ncbi:hypothetical protein JHN45_43165 [Streptomyces sp. MBT53]|nr:hypothetical protein [Streptomyces sp. MBT53]
MGAGARELIVAECRITGLSPVVIAELIADPVQYVVGPIREASSLLSTVDTERPVLPMGSGTHFAVIEDGEVRAVSAMVRFADGPHTTGGVGTLEAPRVIVGPQCGLTIEVYGTDGSASWNFEQLNELRLCPGRGGPDVGYTTVLANASMGDYARFQPGPANSMGFDDLKVVDAEKFLTARAGGEQRNATIRDAHQDAEVLAAVAASAEDGRWHPVSTLPDAA